MARRLDTLENKTIYLIDNGFGGGAEFMLQLQKWLVGRRGSATAGDPFSRVIRYFTFVLILQSN